MSLGFTQGLSRFFSEGATIVAEVAGGHRYQFLPHLEMPKDSAHRVQVP